MAEGNAYDIPERVRERLKEALYERKKHDPEGFAQMAEILTNPDLVRGIAQRFDESLSFEESLKVPTAEPQRREMEKLFVDIRTNFLRLYDGTEIGFHRMELVLVLLRGTKKISG